MPDLQAHSPAMGQKDGEKWTAAVGLQPANPKPDRLLAPPIDPSGVSRSDRAAPSPNTQTTPHRAICTWTRQCSTRNPGEIKKPCPLRQIAADIHRRSYFAAFGANIGLPARPELQESRHRVGAAFDRAKEDRTDGLTARQHGSEQDRDERRDHLRRNFVQQTDCGKPDDRQWQAGMRQGGMPKACASFYFVFALLFTLWLSGRQVLAASRRDSQDKGQKIGAKGLAHLSQHTVEMMDALTAKWDA